MFHIHRGPKMARRKSPLAGTKKVFGLQSSRLFMDARCRQCRDKYPARSVLNDPRPQLTTAGSLHHQMLYIHYMGRVSLNMRSCDPMPCLLGVSVPKYEGELGHCVIFLRDFAIFLKVQSPPKQICLRPNCLIDTYFSIVFFNLVIGLLNLIHA